MRSLLARILALALCVSLTACGSADGKWRGTNVVDAYGTVTRGGEQTAVCVCHDRKAVYLYRDDETHQLLDTAALPASCAMRTGSLARSPSVTSPGTAAAICRCSSLTGI